MRIRPIEISEPIKAFDLNTRFRQIEELLTRLPIRFGNGSPEGNETAPVGTIFMRLDGGAATTLYVKESGNGNVGWDAK